MTGTRVCKKCKANLPMGMFRVMKRVRPSGFLSENRRYTCRKCDNRRRLEYAKKPNEKVRRAKSAKRYRSDPTEKMKNYARGAVSNAIDKGRLVRLPCEQCGAIDTEAHHDDYSKPLDVRWLCRPHHMTLHGRYL